MHTMLLARSQIPQMRQTPGAASMRIMLLRSSQILRVAARKLGWWPKGDLLEEAHRRCTRLERLYVILDKLEDMTTILDLLARLAAARHARHAAAVAFDNLLESRSTPSASSWRTC